MNNYLFWNTAFLVFLSYNSNLYSVMRQHPWITEDAVAFLDNLTQQNKNLRILEFGAGASTIWFAKRTPYLVSIEHNEKWHTMLTKIIQNDKRCFAIDLRLENRPYDNICNKFPDEYFDLILVDGRDRVRCVNASLRILKPGGILMLDDAQRSWYSCVYDLLKDWKFYQTIQTKPDLYGSYAKNKQTNWWVK